MRWIIPFAIACFAASAVLIACGNPKPRETRTLADDPTSPTTETTTGAAKTSTPRESAVPGLTIPPSTTTPIVTATYPPSPTPAAFSPSPTRCAPIVLIKDGEPIEVYGPGDIVTSVPSDGDYVQDSCSGDVYFRDPVTGKEIEGEIAPIHGEQ